MRDFSQEPNNTDSKEFISHEEENDISYKNKNGEADKAALKMVEKHSDLWHIGVIDEIQENDDNSITITCTDQSSNTNFSKRTDRTKLLEKIKIGEKIIFRNEEKNPQNIHWIFTQNDEWGPPFGKNIFSLLQTAIEKQAIAGIVEDTNQKVKNTTKKSFFSKIFK